MSFNIELGGTGVQVMHWQMYGCRGGAGLLPPTEEREGILVFFDLADFFPPPATSRGSNPASIRIGSCHSSPRVLHSSLADS